MSDRAHAATGALGGGMRSLTFDRPPRPRDRTTDGATMDDRTSLFFERDQLGAL